MPDELQRIHGAAVLRCAPDGPVLHSERDFVRECNRSTQVWFLPDVEGFCKQLERLQAARR